MLLYWTGKVNSFCKQTARERRTTDILNQFWGKWDHRIGRFKLLEYSNLAEQFHCLAALKYHHCTDVKSHVVHNAWFTLHGTLPSQIIRCFTGYHHILQLTSNQHHQSNEEIISYADLLNVVANGKLVKSSGLTLGVCWEYEVMTAILNQIRLAVDLREWTVDKVDSVEACRHWNCQTLLLSVAISHTEPTRIIVHFTVRCRLQTTCKSRWYNWFSYAKPTVLHHQRTN